MALPTLRRESPTLTEVINSVMEWPWRRPFWRFDGELPTVEVDMYREDGQIVVKAALPGAKPEEIEATVEGNVLTIRREYEEEKEEKEKDYYYREQKTGSFMRQIEIPQAVDRDRVEAELKNGMLTVRMPIAGPAPTEKKIPIHG